ncbi:DUF1579 domain-containing protein [Deminuibacter soli]|uniref:DUF1579 domain-containing protein n=1 Tax=Deminuibacter soli TaxID=2291815 RepID=A0A3E1NE86_9BACT|nr:DUF1579 domain-containing protein [Deminuibacter soli]RFM26154.1 DUF1579 domain-containing protein [Deminuibacter soli]
MKQSLLALLVTAAAFTACNNAGTATTTAAQTADTTAAAPAKTNSEKKWIAVDSATEMKAWMTYATPGDIHKALARADGNWNVQTTTWAAIGAPPSTAKAKMVNKMMLGGRYQMSNFSGNFMGMPFEGVSVTAYDNAKKKFINTWIDNMGTGLTKMEGTWDSTAKTITYTGTMLNPANNIECDLKEVLTLVDDNNQVMEMWGPDPKTGQQFKSMEMKFTRAK